MGPDGFLSQFKIDPLSYMDRPLDLSNYLLLRTKEKMMLEAELAEANLILKKPPPAAPQAKTEMLKDGSIVETTAESKPPKAAQDVNLLKQVIEIRKDIDLHFAQLDRVLAIAKDKEESFDFPVAFVTNIMYVCAKNGNSHLIDFDSFSEILLKKMDFMHVEGIS